MKKTYYDSWGEAKADGTSIAYPGNTPGNTRNSRIDYIWYSHGASNLVLKQSQVFDVRDANEMERALAAGSRQEARVSSPNSGRRMTRASRSVARSGSTTSSPRATRCGACSRN